MPPKRGHGDLSLKCKGGLRTIVGEGRVENGNSQLDILGAIAQTSYFKDDPSRVPYNPHEFWRLLHSVTRYMIRP